MKSAVSQSAAAAEVQRDRSGSEPVVAIGEPVVADLLGEAAARQGHRPRRRSPPFVLPGALGILGSIWGLCTFGLKGLEPNVYGKVVR